MQARPGDRLVVHGAHVGDRERNAEVLEVMHVDGSPPYLVRWADTGHEGLFFPGPDTVLDRTAEGGRP